MKSASRVAQAVPPAEHAARKLEILCLHGFRQNSKQFKGRLAGLQKKLAKIANFTFIDAPYVLPFWYKQPLKHWDPEGQWPPPQHHHSPQSLSCQSFPSAKRAWLLAPDLLDAQPELQALHAQQAATTNSQQPQLQDAANKLITCMPGTKAVGSNTEPLHYSENSVAASQQLHHQQQDGSQLSSGPNLWQSAPESVTTSDQYTTQCCGWEGSWSVICDALNSGKQYDGILGFSQGAAVAAVVAAVLQQHRQGGTKSTTIIQPLHLDQQDADVTTQAKLIDGSCSELQWSQQTELRSCFQQSASSEQLQCSRVPAIKFVILASGFLSPAVEHQELLAPEKPIQIPSLHIYAGGSSSCDRQIQQQPSEALSEVFEAASRQVLVHDAGHLIPCNKAVVEKIIDFLQPFLC